MYADDLDYKFHKRKKYHSSIEMNEGINRKCLQTGE